MKCLQIQIKKSSLSGKFVTYFRIQNDANVNLDKNVVIGLDGKRINEG
jgi:hypothetical protein